MKKNQEYGCAAAIRSDSFLCKTKKSYCLAVKLRISALCLPPAAQPTNDELLLIFGGYKLQEAGVPA